MRRKLRKDVGLTGALRSEFDQVVVALDEWDQADELEEFPSPAEALGVESDRLHEQIDPFGGAEPSTGFEVLAYVEF